MRLQIKKKSKKIKNLSCREYYSCKDIGDHGAITFFTV